MRPSAAVRTLLLSLVWLPLASAQQTSPTNDTSSIGGNTQYTLVYTLRGPDPISAPLAPLTDGSGRSGSLNQKQMIAPSGNVYLTNPSNIADFPRGNISFISCEPEDYTRDNYDAANLVQYSMNAGPSAIIMYSKYAALCTLVPFGNIPIFSMLSTDLTRGILARLASDRDPLSADITLNRDTVNGNGSNGNSVLGKSPTTAVAMIILYSITGIITALFLIIIVVGAVRAHRHPERYGPRHVIGRPRQSRAKGIARAMLDTLPIVKFGDKEEGKPADATRDVELGPTNADGQGPEASTASEGAKKEDQAKPAAGSEGSEDVKTVSAGEGETDAAAAQASANPVDDGLACSVCTDDFVKGQDIRLLPCKHKFHPECIDPWLLNVSGTCPLCRIDLQPSTGEDSSSSDPNHVPSLEIDHNNLSPTSADPAEGESTPRNNRRSRIVSILNIARMRQASPQERLEALRALREERASASDATRSRRFSRRFSRALSLPASETNSRPVSGVPPAAASGALTSMTEAPSNQEGTEPSQPAAPDTRREGTFSG